MSEPLTDEHMDALRTVLNVVSAANGTLGPYLDGDIAEGFLAALAAVDPPMTVATLDAQPDIDVGRCPERCHGVAGLPGFHQTSDYEDIRRDAAQPDSDVERLDLVSLMDRVPVSHGRMIRPAGPYVLMRDLYAAYGAERLYDRLVNAALGRKPASSPAPCEYEYIGHGVCGLLPEDHLPSHRGGLGHGYTRAALGRKP